MKSLITLLKSWLVISSFIFSATSASHSVYLNISGTVVSPPPCKINGDVDIDVDFGNVSIGHLDSASDTKVDIPLSITCDSSVTKDVSISLVANPTYFNADLIGTDLSDLGIEIKNDSTLLPPGGTLPIELGKDIILTAQLRKNDDESVVIEAGEFTANSTLMVSYE